MKVAVIGGGAAGMMAAVAAGTGGHSVTLYEKNEKLGKKVYITGKGRCNVTNACGREELFSHVVTNPKFLYSAFSAFDNQAVMAFFEKAGCPLKTERGMRVFPVSDHSSDVIRALSGELDRLRVRVRLHTAVKAILEEDGHVTGVELEQGGREQADAVILAGGGLSYPSTGSTGDSYRLAAGLGHDIVPCAPSLVPFVIAEDWCKTLQGLALKNVTVRLMLGGKEVYSDMGEMLFTHFGVSGPLILSASSYYGKKMGQKRAKAKNAEASGKARLLIDLKPALDREQLDRRVLKDFEEHKNKGFGNALDGLFPSRLIPIMIRLSGIAPEKKVHDITKEERLRFEEIIKNLPLTVEGMRGYEEAVITRGGVNVKEVNPSTMESKLIGGLYFAGELLDLDALTGGFNLQIAWSTGYLAGQLL